MNIHIKLVGFPTIPLIDKDICLKDGIKVREIIDKVSHKDEMFQRGMEREQVVIMKNGVSIEYLCGVDTELQDGDFMLILPMQFGG